MAERIHWWTERWLRSPLFLSLSLSFSLFLSLSPSFSLFLWLSTYLSVCLSIYLSIDPSVYISLSLSLFFLSLSLSLALALSIYLPVCLSIYLSVYLQAWKRSYSARLPQVLNLTTSKTQQFSETSSIFALDNVKNEAILRDFLQKSKVECRADGLVPMRFAIFRLRLPKLLLLPQERDTGSYEVLHLSCKIISANLGIWCSKMQPPNSSDEHVSCTAPATENASLQILFKCPTPAILFGNATKPACFAHFWQGAQSRAPATRNDIWTSK